MTISISPLSPGGRGSPSTEPPSGGRGLPGLRELQERWEKLRQAVALWGEDLENKRNILEFLQRVDAARAWIRRR